MQSELGLERCLSFINCQLESDQKKPPGKLMRTHRAITISRETGTAAHEIADKTASLLQPANLDPLRPWTVFDRNLVEKILEDHNLPRSLNRFMAEDRISELADTMDELFGLHPPSWTLVRQSSDTILHLAEIGNVIIIGRGGNIITSRMDHVFHVRLVGGYEKRLARVQETQKLSRRAAETFIKKEDTGRKRYVMKYFDKDINDPLLYHLTINTDALSTDAAAHLITRAVSGDKTEYTALDLLTT